MTSRSPGVDLPICNVRKIDRGTKRQRDTGHCTLATDCSSLAVISLTGTGRTGQEMIRGFPRDKTTGHADLARHLDLKIGALNEAENGIEKLNGVTFHAAL